MAMANGPAIAAMPSPTALKHSTPQRTALNTNHRRHAMKITKAQLRILIESILNETKAYNSLEEFILDTGTAENVGKENTDITAADLAQHFHDVVLPKFRDKFGWKDGKIFSAFMGNIPGYIKDNKFIVLDKSKVPKIGKDNKVDFAREHGLPVDPKTHYKDVKMNSLVPEA